MFQSQLLLIPGILMKFLSTKLCNFPCPSPLSYKIPFPTAAKVLCKGRDGNFRLSDCLGQVKLHGVGHVKPSG